MLGWTLHLTRPAVPVFSSDDPRLHPRRPEFGEYPYMPDDLRGQQVARWFAELGGIAWLTQAERFDGVGVAIRCTGYPSIYAVPVDQVPAVIDREFGRADTVGFEPADVSALGVVPRGEWLIAEVWDQS